MTRDLRAASFRGSAAEFHALVPEPRLQVLEFVVDRPALVIGSTQNEDSIDAAACARLGIEIVRRRSGGGAVLLRPGECGWLDVIVPTGHAGWADDVHAPMVWLGEHIHRALGSDDTDLVHRDGLVSTRWSRIVCFDGLGAGEVTRSRGMDPPAKLVGMSQRRTRQWARLQCVWFTRHDHRDLVDLLARPRPRAEELQPVATLTEDVAAELPALVAQQLAGTAGGDDGIAVGDDGG